MVQGGGGASAAGGLSSAAGGGSGRAAAAQVGKTDLFVVPLCTVRSHSSGGVRSSPLDIFYSNICISEFLKKIYIPFFSLIFSDFDFENF